MKKITVELVHLDKKTPNKTLGVGYNEAEPPRLLNLNGKFFVQVTPTKFLETIPLTL